ncbi:MAG: surface antigen [Candidatus Angelobacter sp.]|nr:surface antigen [Candidatus Angelobacter sp.]
MAHLLQIRTLLVQAVCCAACLGLLPARSLAAEASGPKPPKPATLKISGYGFLGDRELKRMLRTVELATTRPQFFGPAFVEDSALLLTARVKQDGYLEPAIAIQLTLADGGRIQTTAQALMENPLPRPLRITKAEFKIHKGPLYYFQDLEFTGLESVTEKQARSYFMETDTLLHPKSGRVYTPTKLQQGLSSLMATLDRQGYQEASVEVAQLRRDDKTGKVTARIRVHQGPKFIVHLVREEIFYQGVPEPAQTRTTFPDKPYSKLWAQAFILSLKTNQYVLGFPDVTADLRTLERKPTAGQVQVDLLATVKTGPKVWIGAVEFAGEKKVRKRLMSRRIKIARGELLNPIQVEAGRARLAELGIFDSVDVNYRTVNDHTRDVTYQVKESKALNLSLLFGWGSYELLRGGFIVSESDILGLAHHAELTVIQSIKSSSGDFRYTVPEAIGKDVDLFVQASGLRRQEVDFTRLEYGGGLGAHKYFKSSAFDASVHYNYQILSALNTIPLVGTEGLTNPAVGSITADLRLDRRDNPLYPRKGYKVFTTIESATQYLGGEGNYERIEFSPSWYHPLGDGRYISLGVSHGVAASFGSSSNNLPFIKRFFPGGSDSIRGYQQDEASPRNSQGQIVGAETYTLFTVQLEQALTSKWSLIIFSDSLGFAHSLDHYPFDTGLYSVGAGIWWRTLIGPVRLEYGHNLNPRPGDPSGTLLFSLGFPF